MIDIMYHLSDHEGETVVVTKDVVQGQPAQFVKNMAA